MRNKLLAIALLSLFIFGGWTMQSRSFEYKTVELTLNSSTEAKLNELGAQGWEMVTAQQRVISMGITSNVVVYHFKRAK